MGANQPRAVRTPYEGTQSQATTNSYGFASQDPNNPFVQAYLDAPIDTDPGVARRADVAEQAMQNRWNSAFASNIPQALRMQQMDTESRNLRAEAAAQQQQAEYLRNALNLSRAERLLPQLVSTGGSTTGSQSGFGTQIGTPQGGFWNSFTGGLGGSLGGFL